MSPSAQQRCGCLNQSWLDAMMPEEFLLWLWSYMRVLTTCHEQPEPQKIRAALPPRMDLYDCAHLCSTPRAVALLFCYTRLPGKPDFLMITQPIFTNHTSLYSCGSHLHAGYENCALSVQGCIGFWSDSLGRP